VISTILFSYRFEHERNGGTLARNASSCVFA